MAILDTVTVIGVMRYDTRLWFDLQLSGMVTGSWLRRTVRQPQGSDEIDVVVLGDH